MDYTRIITQRIESHIETANATLSDRYLLEKTAHITGLLVDCYRAGNKLYICGNGGSAADAQHIAAELSGKFYIDRSSLFAEAMHVNTSYMTAVANDYGFDYVYERIIDGQGRAGDVLIGLSTSGNSANILRAVNKANEKGMVTIGLTGKQGGQLLKTVQHNICVPSDDTPRIQEIHILLMHIVCELVESALFSKK
ncbi:MAG: SIS domain-containing protein [Bacteroidales bacterium]|jgi:D-sedoheptulose 7-phosphate isomerase|nr:SIS domain-containing protein [Bacteroidales bacterium]